jgi:hypothetical protein
VLEGLEALNDATLYGEWYRMGKHITKGNPDAELFWHTTVENCKGAYRQEDIREEGQHIMWVIPIKKGRHFYFPFGHDKREVDPFPGNTWDKLIKQGLYYTAGYDTVALTSVASINRKKFNGSSISVRYMNVSIPARHTIQVTDIHGAVVFSQSAAEAGDYDLSGLQTGFYFIKVDIPGITETQKVLIY